MNVEQEKFLARLQSCGTQLEAIQVINDAVLRIIGQRNEAEQHMKTLAKHCLVVISEPVHFGDHQRVMWCTVCQVRLILPWSGEYPKFIHKPDCLVEKVTKEA